MNIKIQEIIIKKFWNLCNDIMQHKHANYWLDGGRGSTKSSFIGIMVVLLILKNPQVNALVLRKVGQTLKDSVYNQIMWAIDLLGLTTYFKATRSPLEITYLPTGQKIYFRGADKPEKIKSIKPQKGYIGITWFEELDQFEGEEETRKILQSANRGGSIMWNFYSFNPPKSRDNWVNLAIKEKKENKIAVHTTYLDVPKEWLGQMFFDEAEYLKKTKPQAYEHEYLGIATGTGGAVFENLEFREIPDKEVETMGYFGEGLDFGFAVDPLAWVKVSYNRKTRTLYLIDEIYQTKLSNKMAVDMINKKNGYDLPEQQRKKGYGIQVEKQQRKKEPITGDSAEPRTISEFNNLGLFVLPAKKGPDSVQSGIKWLQDLEKIVIDRNRTPNAAKEFDLYEYEKDKNGNFISKYPDKNNHAIDAVRYALETEILRKEIKWG